MYFFLHISSGRSWPTDDPHRWLLDHRDDDLLAPARERLLATPEGTDRCLRVVLRRCGLALVRVVNALQVVVHHWSEPAPDLRSWVREHGFNRPDVQVVLVNVKNGQVVVHEDGLDLLVYGEPAGDTFSWPEYTAKYGRRWVEEGDDGTVAPAAWTNFAWPGAPHERLTWAVLKAVWGAESIPCSNCDVPLLVTSILWQRGMLSFRSAWVARHCVRCRRRFEFNEQNPLGWLSSVLGPELRPTYLALWRRFEIEWSDPNHRLA